MTWDKSLIASTSRRLRFQRGGGFALLKRRLQLVYEHPMKIKRGREQRGRERKISIASTNREINNAGLSRMHRAVDRFSINLKKNFLFCRNKKKRKKEWKNKKEFTFPVLSGISEEVGRWKCCNENIRREVPTSIFAPLVFIDLAESCPNAAFYFKFTLNLIRGSYLSFVASITMQSKVCT